MQSNVILSIWDENEIVRGKIKTVTMTVITHTQNEEAQHMFLFYTGNLT